MHTLEIGAVVTARVESAVTGGVLVTINDQPDITSAFIPASHLDIGHVDDLVDFVGRELDVEIIKVSKRPDGLNVVASRRQILQSQSAEARAARIAALAVGDEITGTITNITDFGAFVSLGDGAGALIHISELDWGYTRHPADVVELGEVVTARVASIDDKGRPSLSLRQMRPNPFETFAETHPKGSIVVGTVIDELEDKRIVSVDGVTALLRADVPVGEEITAEVSSVDPVRRRITLELVA